MLKLKEMDKKKIIVLFALLIFALVTMFIVKEYIRITDTGKLTPTEYVDKYKLGE